jgi:hypothetical protein
MVLHAKETASPKTKAFAVVLVSIISFVVIGCIAAVPIAVKMYKEKDMVKLIMQVGGNSNEIFLKHQSGPKKGHPQTWK